MRSRSVALIVGSDSLTSCVQTGGVLQVRTSMIDSTTDSVDRAVHVVLGEIPRTRWRGVTITVVLGANWSQFKRLDGIAAAARGADARRAVEAGASRFFVHGGSRFVVAGIESREHQWWGAALDADLVHRVTAAIARARMTLRGFVPAPALGIDPDGRSVGNVDEAHAIAAIALPNAHPLLFDPHTSERDARRRRHKRTLLAAATVVSAMLALFAPGIRATLARRDAAHRWNAIAAAGLEESADSLRRLRVAVAATRDLLGPSTPVGPIIAEITSRLPNESAIVSLRIDSRALDLVMLVPVAIKAVAAFDDLEGFHEARIVGAVTRETIEGRAVQRVALHLARVKPAGESMLAITSAR